MEHIFEVESLQLYLKKANSEEASLAIGLRPMLSAPCVTPWLGRHIKGIDPGTS